MDYARQAKDIAQAAIVAQASQGQILQAQKFQQGVGGPDALRERSVGPQSTARTGRRCRAGSARRHVATSLHQRASPVRGGALWRAEGRRRL